MTNILNFEIKHLIGFHLKYEYKTLVSDLIRAKEDPSCELFSVFVKNYLIAIVGARFIRDGVVELWAIIGRETFKFKKSFHKAIKSMISKSVKTFNIHRMQITVKEDFHKGFKWARSLGFETECLMKAFGSDRKNHYLMSRIIWAQEH